jgi:hypothetical protein
MRNGVAVDAGSEVQSMRAGYARRGSALTRLGPFASFESKMTYRQAIDDFVSWVPDPVARRKIGGETALKFYFSGLSV